MSTGTIDPRYGNAAATPPPWEDVERRLAEAWFAKYGDDWHFEVRDEEFVEVSGSGGSTQGGARVYTVAPDKVILFGGDHGQTTYLLRATTT